jgi:hypothetical protein
VRWVARNLGGQPPDRDSGRSWAATRRRYETSTIKVLTLVSIALCGLLIGPYSPALAVAAIIVTYFATARGFRALQRRMHPEQPRNG